MGAFGYGSHYEHGICSAQPSASGIMRSKRLLRSGVPSGASCGTA